MIPLKTERYEPFSQAHCYQKTYKLTFVAFLQRAPNCHTCNLTKILTLPPADGETKVQKG